MEVAKDDAVSQAEAEALVPQFQVERILNQGQLPPRLTLIGHIPPSSSPSLLILEPSFPPLPSAPSASLLASLPARLRPLDCLGRNDVYAWFLSAIAPAPSSAALSPPASTDPASPPNPAAALAPPAEPLVDASAAKPPAPAAEDASGLAPVPTLRLTLIHPASEQHLRKHAPQRLRAVRETPAIYRARTKPFIAHRTWGGAKEKGVRWVGNILDGTSEAENVLYRHVGPDAEGARKEGWVLLPDMNWDRRDREALRLLCLVERRDIASLRDLRKGDVKWLKGVLAEIEGVVAKEFEVEGDQLRFYVHYQPSYYHFHIHVAHVALAPGPTIALGRAFSLRNLLAQLEGMQGGAEVGLEDVEIEYTVGDEGELWKEVWEPLKKQQASNGESVGKAQPDHPGQ